MGCGSGAEIGVMGHICEHCGSERGCRIVLSAEPRLIDSDVSGCAWVRVRLMLCAGCAKDEQTRYPVATEAA